MKCRKRKQATIVREKKERMVAINAFSPKLQDTESGREVEIQHRESSKLNVVARETG